MSGGVADLVSAGPLLLAIPVAAAAGAVTFLSPCVLPLVPGYLSYITGMSGVAVVGAGPVAVAGDAAAISRPSRSRTLVGAALFVVGFSALFATYGYAFGQVGVTLRDHARVVSQVLGVILVVLGLLFAGVFDRFGFAARMLKPSVTPRAGLAGAPLLGVLFGLGWTPCIGPTLSAVLALSLSTGTASRGALLAFVYGLGIGIPLLAVAFAVDRGVTLFGFARRHARLITRIGGVLLIMVGLLEVTGAWTAAMAWLQTHWVNGYTPPI
jgi:cytochrome c-type biogenesis protein